MALEQEYHEAQEYLADVAKRYSDDQPFRLATPLAAPGAAIVDAAEMQGCDLIGMVTRGLSGVRRILHSSVAGYVLHHSVVPLLLVRDHETAVSEATRAETKEPVPV